MDILNFVIFFLQVNQFNRTGDHLASGMGYNTVIWQASDDQDAALGTVLEQTRSKRGRTIIPLPRGNRTARDSRGRVVQGRGVKRKRPDDKDIKKKKMKTITG